MYDASRIDPGVIFDAAPTAHLVFTPDLRIVAVNKAYCTLLDRQAGDLIGMPVFEAFPANPDDPDANAEAELRASAHAVVASGEPQKMPLRHHDVQEADGRYETRYWRVLNSPVFADPDAPHRVTHVIHTVEDVTRSILGDRAEAAKRRAAMRGADLSYFELDPQAGNLVRSPQVDALFGFVPSEAGPDVKPFYDRVHSDDFDVVIGELERVSRTIGADLHLNFRVLLPDGSTRWLLGRGESVRDPETRNVRIVGIVIDVTTIRESEANLREALEARDLLIAEVNHRVKNSLQMVTSILNLEASGSKNPEARASLRAATARVNAVAAIHASLYEDADVSSVQIDRYLERLSTHLRSSLSSDGRNVRISLDVEPIRLRTDKAVTLSLAVNELVTNSFKHASWEGDGTVRVSLTQHDNEMIALDVSDDGTEQDVSRSEGAGTSSGLGQRLISGMAAQLGGTIEKDITNGWRTRIVFPK